MKMKSKSILLIALAMILGVGLTLGLLSPLVTVSHSMEKTGLPDPETLFGEGAIYMDEFLEQHPNAKVDGKSSNSDIAPIALLPNTEVDPEWFQFVLTEGITKQAYYTINDLRDAGYTVTVVGGDPWKGPIGGEQNDKYDTYYPDIKDHELRNITVNGTYIHRLGTVQFTDANGTVQRYVYISALDTVGDMSNVVLPDNAKHAIHLNYSSTKTSNIRYQVYVDRDLKADSGNSKTEPTVPEEGSLFALDKIFGNHRAEHTVDEWFAVDVSIPNGYIAKVEIGEDNGRLLTEVFPWYDASNENDIEYGEHRLGVDVEYKVVQRSNGYHYIEVDPERGPGYFSMSDTYISGPPGSAKGDQIVRVTLTERDPETVTFNKLWDETEFTGFGDRYINGERTERTYIYPLIYNNTGIVNKDVIREPGDEPGTYNFTWILSTDVNTNEVTSRNKRYELDYLEINGAAVKVPQYNPLELAGWNAGTPSNTNYYDGRWKWERIKLNYNRKFFNQDEWPDFNTTEETKLPSGAIVRVTLMYIDQFGSAGNKAFAHAYKVEVIGANRAVTVTGGNLRKTTGSDLAETTPELFVGEMTGVAAEILIKGVWTPVNQGDPISYDKLDVNGNYWMNPMVRVKLLPGYKFPVNADGLPIMQFGRRYEKLKPARLYDVHSDGWYYVLNDVRRPVEELYPKPEDWPTYNSNDIDAGGYWTPNLSSMLEMKAETLKYQVLYQDGVNNGSALNGENVDRIEVDADTMPTFQESGSALDTNHDDFYSMSSSLGNYNGSTTNNKITITWHVPQDMSDRPATFQYWVVTDVDGNPLDADGNKLSPDNPEEWIKVYTSNATSLLTVLGGAEEIDSTEHLHQIYLTAYWKINEPPFTYYITFNKTDKTGTEIYYIEGYDDHSMEDIYDEEGNLVQAQGAVAKRETFFVLDGDTAKLNGLPIVFDDRAEAAINWLANNPWYKYDLNQNSSTNKGEFYWPSVPNHGIVDVWFISTISQLSVEKEYSSKNHDWPEDGFKFKVTFTLPAEDDNGSQGDETKWFDEGIRAGAAATGVYSVPWSGDGANGENLTLQKETNGTYTGIFYLKPGEEATEKNSVKVFFDLPEGTQYVIEEEIESSSEYVQLDKEGDSGTIPSPTGDMMAAIFTNAFKGGIAVMKEQARNNGTPSHRDINNLRAGDTITYTITVENTSDYEANDVTVTDYLPMVDGAVPEWFRVDEDSISDNGVLDLDNGTITWTIDSIESGENVTVTFNVTIGAPDTHGVFTLENKAGASTLTPGIDDSESDPVKATYSAYSLDVSKTVAGDAADVESIKQNEKFSFTFTLTGTGLHETAGYPYTADDDVEVISSDGEIREDGLIYSGDVIKLKHGQTITINGIPVNATYRVLEADVNGRFVVNPANRTRTGTPSAASEVKALFTNTRNSSTITIDKTQSINGAEATKNQVNVKQGNTITYTLTVKANANQLTAENVVVSDAVPEGLELDESSITDSGVAQDGDKTWTVDDGIITWKLGNMAADATRTLTFTAKVPDETTQTSWRNTATAIFDNRPLDQDKISSNTVTASLPGTLKISKTVSGSGGSRIDSFVFTILLTSGTENPSLNGKYIVTKSDGINSEEAEIYFSNGQAVVELKHGESITIEELLGGTVYSIIESNASSYVTTIENADAVNDKRASGKINAGTTVSIAYENNRETSVPTNVTMDFMWLFPVLLIVIAGTGTIVFKKRRKKAK